MEYIIITIAVLAGVVIGYTNGRQNEKEDNEQRLRELAEKLVKDFAAGERGEETEHGVVWHSGALWAIERLMRDD